MVKKSERPPLIDDLGSSAERALAQERDRPVVEEDVARDVSDLEVRGRRYRIGVHDGFVGIWELRSGEQVGTFMEDAFSAAWARYLELEQSRSFNGFMLRTRESLAHRWYAIVVVVLGALTVVYLKTEDPALSPTGARAAAPEAPRAVQPIADLGSSLAGTLDPALAAPPRSAEEGQGREQKKDRGAGKEGPAGAGGNAAPSSPSGDASGASTSGGTSVGTSGGTSGGSQGGNTGDSTGGDGGGGGTEQPPPPPPEEPPDEPEDPAPPEP